MRGHPDKICDQISDAVLDEFLMQDPDSRVAIETMGGKGKIFITGEVTSRGVVDYEKIVRRVQADVGFGGEYEVVVNVSKQSPDISRGVDNGGAGDQGVMIGYATKETAEMLPLPFEKAKSICVKLFEIGRETGLGPDGKAQVTVDDDGKPVKIVVSVQHPESMSVEEVRQVVLERVLTPLFGDLEGVDLFINATGKFVIGGFEGDAGLTGRKIVVDAYGPEINVGGGAFSGKDPSKVDRSAAYMARYLAKWLVANYNLPEAKVSLAYSIGIAEPMMVDVESHPELGKVLREHFDLTPKGIIDFLDLKKPIYYDCASLGHFGVADRPWEQKEFTNLPIDQFSN